MITRKFFGAITQKLSVTVLLYLSQCRGTLSCRKSRVASGKLLASAVGLVVRNVFVHDTPEPLGTREADVALNSAAPIDFSPAYWTGVPGQVTQRLHNALRDDPICWASGRPDGAIGIHRCDPVTDLAFSARCRADRRVRSLGALPNSDRRSCFP